MEIVPEYLSVRLFELEESVCGVEGSGEQRYLAFR